MCDDKVVGIVLAGGEGKRLRPLTYYFQKCMIPIGGRQKPLLEYILVHMRRHGIIDVNLLVGYKREQIMNYFNDGSRFGVKIRYFLDDPSIVGSGGALLNSVNKGAFQDASTLLVYYGDILSNIDLSKMVDQHVESEAAATLAVIDGFQVPVGIAEVEGRIIKGWVEKPRIDVYAGIGVVALNSVALRALTDLAVGQKNIDIMSDLIPFLIDQGESVEAYLTDAFWYDVGSTERYEKIDNGLIDKLFNH